MNYSSTFLRAIKNNPSSKKAIMSKMLTRFYTKPSNDTEIVRGLLENNPIAIAMWYRRDCFRKEWDNIEINSILRDYKFKDRRQMNMAIRDVLFDYTRVKRKNRKNPLNLLWVILTKRPVFTIKYSENRDVTLKKKKCMCGKTLQTLNGMHIICCKI